MKTASMNHEELMKQLSFFISNQSKDTRYFLDKTFQSLLHAPMEETKVNHVLKIMVQLMKIGANSSVITAGMLHYIEKRNESRNYKFGEYGEEISSYVMHFDLKLSNAKKSKESLFLKRIMVFKDSPISLIKVADFYETIFSPTARDTEKSEACRNYHKVFQLLLTSDLLFITENNKRKNVRIELDETLWYIHQSLEEKTNLVAAM